mgnify:CR=1 FL=1
MAVFTMRLKRFNHVGHDSIMERLRTIVNNRNEKEIRSGDSGFAYLILEIFPDGFEYKIQQYQREEVDQSVNFKSLDRHEQNNRDHGECKIKRDHGFGFFTPNYYSRHGCCQAEGRVDPEDPCHVGG